MTSILSCFVTDRQTNDGQVRKLFRKLTPRTLALQYDMAVADGNWIGARRIAKEMKLAAVL